MPWLKERPKTIISIIRAILKLIRKILVPKVCFSRAKAKSIAS